MEDNNPAMDPPAMDPVADDMAPEEMAAAQEPVVAAVPADEKQSLLAKSERQETQASEGIDESEHCPCCCCLCACSTHETKDLTCFGCFPVRCGIYAISISSVFIGLFLFLEIFVLLMSPNVHWWYSLVAAVVLIPFLVGIIFQFNFFCKDDNASRGKLDVACYLAIISFTLLAAWNVAYFTALFKGDSIIIGNEETGVLYRTSKKEYILWSIFIACIADFFYGYYVCVNRRYWYRLREKEEPAMDMDMEKMNKQD